MKLFDVYPLLPVTPVKAYGSYLWDKEDNKYLDFYGGHAVISVGHNHPVYNKKITNQLHQIGFYSNSVSVPPQQELAHKLGVISNYPDYQLFLCNSGAEANENAFKIASFHTGRKKIVAFRNAFHGRTSATVAATDDASILSPVNASDNFIFCEWNNETQLQQILETREIAAMIIEGVQGVAGIRTPNASFLRAAAAFCRSTGTVFICDEIQSGYGRTGNFFAHQSAGVQPDIITSAKGMGNGFPVAGVLIAPKFEGKHGMLGTTFGGSHLACAAGIAVLEIIQNENLMDNAKEKGNYLMQEIAAIPGVKEVRGQGLMIGIELHQPCASLRQLLLNKFCVFTGSSSDKNTMRILPALNITYIETSLFMDAFQRAMHQTMQSVGQA